MTQKQALARILEFAQRNMTGDNNSAIAARAAFVILWLTDMNWHGEARALSDRMLATPRLKAAFQKLEQDEKRTGQLQDAVVLFNWLFGWGLNTDEWRATQGATLVEELWNIIAALP